MCTFTTENLIDITKFIIGEETVKSFKQFMYRLFDVIFEQFFALNTLGLCSALPAFGGSLPWHTYWDTTPYFYHIFIMV